MQSWLDYFTLGMQSIVHLNGYGHLLFIIAMCGIYTLTTWKKVTSLMLYFVAAFIITFIISAYNLLEFPENIFTYLVPFTILFTAISNFNRKKQAFTNRYPTQNYRYYLSFLSGLVHGFAFQNALNFVNQSQLQNHIFSFVLGIVITLGLIVFFLLVAVFIITYFLRFHLREWNLIISGGCAGIAIYILLSLL
ncbi:HupE/UreJ family protein [Cytophagaceae bacterium ABcell3]|nr:HupE/UreJ family protein [Cytophagaceae bacterium ABcell3]